MILKLVRITYLYESLEFIQNVYLESYNNILMIFEIYTVTIRHLFNFITELLLLFLTPLFFDQRHGVVRSTFNIKLNGYIVPEILQKDINSIKKFSDKTKLIFSIEASSLDSLYNGQDKGDGSITTPETLKSLEIKKKINII